MHSESPTSVRKMRTSAYKTIANTPGGFIVAIIIIMTCDVVSLVVG